MVAINAYRMDGLGNDFIIIDRRENFIEIKKNKIIELGNRANIGFDQIIFIEKQREDSYPITIYNSDGGEVSACGNGARCVAYLLSKNLNTKKIQINTNNRLLYAKIVVTRQVIAVVIQRMGKRCQQPVLLDLSYCVKVTDSGDIHN